MREREKGKERERKPLLVQNGNNSVDHLGFGFFAICVQKKLNFIERERERERERYRIPNNVVCSF